MAVPPTSRRTVITGIGIVGPTGSELSSFWRTLLEGPSSIQRVTRFDPTSYRCQVGGQVHNRDYEQLLDPRKLRTTTHATQMALAATVLALRDAHLAVETLAPERVGVSIGSALAGWREAEQQFAVLLEKGARRVNPFVANRAPPYSLGIEIASSIVAEGPQSTHAGGCTAGLHAIGDGARLVADGALDACLAGGTESPLTPLVFAGMGRTMELSPFNDRPDQASRPFDRSHAGMVLSEGSCMFVLESEEQAAHRGVEPYGSVLGFAVSCDAQGAFTLDEDGVVGARTVRQALSRAGLDPARIDYVCSHANSAPSFDRKEAAVLQRAFGDFTMRLPVSSIKGVLGHSFAASGAFQVAASLLAMRHSTIPPTHNLEDPDPACVLRLVMHRAHEQPLEHVLITSYGYGGTNACLVLRR